MMRSAVLIFGLAAMFALCAAMPAGAANILAVEPSGATAAVGDTIDLTLRADFDDTTLGGGVTLDFDSAVLELGDVTFTGGLGDEPDFRCPTDPAATDPVPCASTPNFVSFGSFAGISGEGSVATLSMNAIGVGSTEVGLRGESPFSSPSGSELDVSLSGATVNVVPEPGTVGLLGLGLAALGARTTRRSR